MRIDGKAVAAVALVIAACVVLFARSQIASARVDKIEADALAEAALDTADAIRGRLEALARADSVEEAVRADSAAAWEARVAEAERVGARAQLRAESATRTLEEHLSGDDEGLAALDSLNAAHEVKLEAERTRTASEAARADRAEEAEARQRALFLASEQESQTLRAAIDQMEISLDARDAIIRGLETEKLVWQVGGVASAGLAAVALLGVIGG